MIFVDTSAWFAAIVPSDPNHPHATSWLAQSSEPLLTTDYVIDEILTLLRAPVWSAEDHGERVENARNRVRSASDLHRRFRSQ